MKLIIICTIVILICVLIILFLHYVYNINIKNFFRKRAQLIFPKYTGCEKFLKYNLNKIPKFNINGIDIDKNNLSLGIYFDPINNMWFLSDNKTDIFELDDKIILNIEGVNYYGTIKELDEEDKTIIISIDIPGTDNMRFPDLKSMIIGRIIFTQIKNNK